MKQKGDRREQVEGAGLKTGKKVLVFFMDDLLFHLCDIPVSHVTLS